MRSTIQEHNNAYNTHIMTYTSTMVSYSEHFAELFGHLVHLGLQIVYLLVLFAARLKCTIYKSTHWSNIQCMLQWYCSVGAGKYLERNDVILVLHHAILAHISLSYTQLQKTQRIK